MRECGVPNRAQAIGPRVLWVRSAKLLRGWFGRHFARGRWTALGNAMLGMHTTRSGRELGLIRHLSSGAEASMIQRGSVSISTLLRGTSTNTYLRFGRHINTVKLVRAFVQALRWATRTRRCNVSTSNLHK